MARAGDDLIAALEAAPGVDGWIAALWTWLQPRLAELDSRIEKLWALRRLGRSAALDETLDLVAALDELRASDDLARSAALRLVVLDRWVAELGRAGSVSSFPVPGVDGADHVVAARGSWLAEAFWEGSSRERRLPPATDYAPDMAILAPALTVCPARLAGVELQVVSAPDDTSVAARRSLEAARGLLAKVRSGEPGEGGASARMIVHLSTLGPNPRATPDGGLDEADGFVVAADHGTFSYRDPPEGSALHDDIRAAVEAAVRIAERDGAMVLLMPELALPATALDELKELLRDTPGAPALTVAGLRHRDVVAAGEPEVDAAGATLSRWANEAVVLGSDGVELLRHRKLTAYAIGRGGPQEDTRLGSRLAVLPTGIGDVAVLTCLDAFAGSWMRLLRSPASVVLVPSLSPRVNPHRTTLAAVSTWLWGMAFVCNRHPTQTGEGGWRPDPVRSCWTVAMLNGWQPATPHPDGDPTLVFDLDSDRAAVQ